MGSEKSTYMRSQSLTGLLGYDLFLFTFLQQILALELSVNLGTYTHMIGSLHAYEDEIDHLRRISPQRAPPGPMPAELPFSA